MKEIKKLWKDYKFVIIVSILVGFVVHLPLFTKNILTGDVLLNTGYYSGYVWEVSLGRFGLYFLGVLKGFMVIPHLEIFLGIVLLILSMILIFELLDIKKKWIQILCCLLGVVFPVCSCTFLFHYCSFSYMLAFFFSVAAIYLFVRSKNVIFQYLVPVILVIASLSFYQAYLGVSVSLLLCYYLVQISKKKDSFKKVLTGLVMVFVGVIFYYLLMKLSLVVFDVELSSYKNANQAGLGILLKLPSQIIQSYKSFYQFYFTDVIVNNKNVGLTIWYLGFFLMLLVVSFVFLVKKKLPWYKILLFYGMLVLLPISLNMVFLVVGGDIQILQCASYLLPFFLLAYFMQDGKIYPVVLAVLFIGIIRCYMIQDYATYYTLNVTYQKTYLMASDIREDLNQYSPSKVVMITGNISYNEYYQKESTTELGKMQELTYGYVSLYPLFWEEYTNMKNGWSRFFEEYLGYPITFVDYDKYQKILESHEYQKMKCYPNKGGIKEIDGVVVVKLAN